ncbi:hypothetical protein EMGBS8_06670 [Verrucomicrobiota bacterium]|nr:hypothetical protein EMGBS8_06670 [Verrucomicrobiota bacterium]
MSALTSSYWVRACSRGSVRAEPNMTTVLRTLYFLNLRWGSVSSVMTRMVRAWGLHMNSWFR